jgi:ketosteroid isomerase-like protein
MASNADRLKTFYAAVQLGDFERASQVFSPDVAIRTRLESHMGRDAAKRMLEEAFSEFESDLEIEELIERPPDAVVACYRLRMRGRYSNIDSSESLVDVARFRDGLIYSVDVFSSKDEALASIG